MRKAESELTFISWAPHCSRSDSIAARLGGTSHMVYSPFWGSRPSTVLFKYLVQAWRTLRILWRERPQVVFVMAPPIVACLPVWLYCRIFNAAYIVDAHTGAFDDPRWRRLQWLQRFFSRRATTTIVTNEYLSERVQTWGAASTIVRDVPVEFPEPAPVELEGECVMTLVSSFCDDEPIEEFLEAARQVPEVSFYVTGDDRRLAPELGRLAPSNVRFTGFLSEAEYVGQLLNSDAIIALTTCDHTMQRGAYEAVYLQRPVITSDFPLLRECFSQGAVHVRPDSAGIRIGIQRMLDNLDTYRMSVSYLRKKRLHDWKDSESQLTELVNGSTHHAAHAC